jgi:RimJ/RimL family protein N-acetyltransferase
VVPQIDTERLRLRAFSGADVEPHARMLGDPEVVRYIGDQTLNREQAWRRLTSAAGMWIPLGFGYWAIERRADGAYLGLLGFADFKRDLTPSIEGLPEMGWIFCPEGQGKGYASEAGRAALNWLDRALPGREAVAIIDADNGPSIRLARRLGFDEGREAGYGDHSIMLFRRPAPSPAASATASATPA